MNNSGLFKNGKIILDSISISSFDDYHRLVAGRYKDMDISFSGYPGKNGGHALITSDISLAINSQSGNITAAWDILKEFYMYDFQKELDDCFPTNKKAFYEAGSKAMIPEKDDSGNVLPVYFHDGSESIEIGYLTEEEKNDCIDLLIGKSGTCIYDLYIYDVCDDELAPFYNDDQSAEETARRIQKRISMYLNEQK